MNEENEMRVINVGIISELELIELFATQKQKDKYYANGYKFSGNNKQTVLKQARRECEVEDLKDRQYEIKDVYKYPVPKNFDKMNSGLYKYLIPLILIKLILMKIYEGDNITFSCTRWFEMVDLINRNYINMKQNIEYSSRKILVDENVLTEYFGNTNDVLLYLFKKSLEHLKTAELFNYQEINWVCVRELEESNDKNNKQTIDIKRLHRRATADEMKFIRSCDQIACMFANIAVDDYKEKYYGVKSHMSNIAFEENVALQNEAQIRYATTESQLLLLSNATEQLKIAIGDSLNPAINSASGAITDFTLEAADFLEQNKWLVQAITVLTVFVGTATGGVTLYAVGIKALTAAKAALGITTVGTTATIKAFSAALIASPLGPYILALAALAGAITAVTIAAGAQEEATKQVIGLSKAMKEQVSNIGELKNKINNESISRESLIDLMNLHNEKYGEELSAIADINEAREEAIRLLDEEAKRKAEETIRETGGAYVKQKDFLKNQYVVAGASGFSYPYKNPETYLETLEKTIDSYTARIDSLSTIEKAQLNNASNQYSELKNKIEEATAVVEAYEIAQSILAGTYNYVAESADKVVDKTSSVSGSFVETQADNIDKLSGAISAWNNAQTETEKTYQKSLIDDILKSWLKDIEEIGDAILQTEAFKEYEKALEMVAAGTESAKPTIDFLNDLQSSYKILTDAQTEYNETGSLTASTFKALVDNNLLQYLDNSSGKLIINAESLKDMGEAAKVAAIQELQTAAAADILALSTGNLESLSITAKSAIAQMGDNASIAGGQAANAAGQMAVLAQSMQDVINASQGKLSAGISEEDFKAKSDAIMSSYMNIANGISNISISSPSKSKSSGSSSKINFSDIWEKRYGQNKYLYDKGELDAESYWDGFKKVNDQLLKEYGSSYQKEWQSKDVQWMNSGYQDERKMIEEDFKYKITTAKEYFEDLEKLRGKYYKADSLISNKVLRSNQEDYYSAIQKEFDDKMKVIEHL